MTTIVLNLLIDPTKIDLGRLIMIKIILTRHTVFRKGAMSLERNKWILNRLTFTHERNKTTELIRQLIKSALANAELTRMDVGMMIDARDTNALHLLVLVSILAATLKEGRKVSTIVRRVAVG